MAFCAKCGNEVLDTAVVCVKCGCALNGTEVKPTCEKWASGTFTALVITSFIIPFVGIIGGIMGLLKPARKQQGGILLACGVVGMILWSAIR